MPAAKELFFIESYTLSADFILPSNVYHLVIFLAKYYKGVFDFPAEIVS